jgi:hypothetical protein
MLAVRRRAIQRILYKKYIRGTYVIYTAILLAFLFGHVICSWVTLGYEHKCDLQMMMMMMMMIMMMMMMMMIIIIIILKGKVNHEGLK